MSAFSFFRKKEVAAAEPVTEGVRSRLERTSTLIIESISNMTFDQNSGLTGLKVRTLRSLVPGESWLSVTGLVPNNEIGLGSAQLEPIAELLNSELKAEARPFQVLVSKYQTGSVGFGEDSATDSASYILKVQEIPRDMLEPGTNVLSFDRR